MNKSPSGKWLLKTQSWALSLSALLTFGRCGSGVCVQTSQHLAFPGNVPLLLLHTPPRHPLWKLSSLEMGQRWREGCSSCHLAGGGVTCHS